MAATCTKREGKRGVSWYARVCWSEDGARRQKHVSAPTKRACEDLVRATLTAADAGAVARDAKRTVGEELDDWLRASAARLKPQTHRAYADAVRLHVKPALGDVPLAKLRPADIERAWQAKLDARSAPNHVRHMHAVLSQCLKRAVRLDRLRANPCERVELPARAPYAAAPLDAVAAKRLLALADSHRLRAMWVVLVYCALRQGEVAGLHWADVDLAAGVLRVQRQRRVIGSEVVEIPPKSGAGRRAIALSATPLAALREHRARTEAEQGALPTHVFVTRRGAPYHPRTLGALWENLRRAAGAEGVRFHDLRHTGGAALVTAGVHPKVAQARLGHADLATTMAVYSHVVGDAERLAAEAVEAVLGGGVLD